MKKEKQNKNEEEDEDNVKIPEVHNIKLNAKNSNAKIKKRKCC